MPPRPARNIVLRFDMRAAADCPDSAAERYRAVIDMAAWADQHAIDVVGLSEHHFTADGFLSAPLALAGMLIARTTRVRVNVSALLVPLHEPFRLAEDITVLDLVSGGRFTATAGLGYRKLEYDQLGVDWQRRGQVFDEKLSVLVQALQGHAVEYNGSQARLNPAPLSPVQALLMVGGNSPAAAKRAARFGLLFSPAIDDPELEQIYQQACRDYGVSFGFTIHPREPATTFISDDPVNCWKRIGKYLLYDATAYGAWRHPNRRAYAESFASNLEELIAEGKYRVVTPEQAIALIEETGSLHLAPLCGGVPLAEAWQSLKLFEDNVQPYL